MEIFKTILFLSSAFLLEAKPTTEGEFDQDNVRAVVNIVGTVHGKITLEETNFGLTEIKGELKGLTSNAKHGFHIHEYGDLSNSCKSAGGHYNPYGKTHGGPMDSIRHVGDLGNIVADMMGNSMISIFDKQVKLTGRKKVIGRSIVVHKLTDDLGDGGDDGSKATGNAGARIGCGIIEKS